MTLYGLTPSPFYRKCLVLMEEKGLDYETEALIPFPKTDKLMSMHPMGKIPILQDGDNYIADSSIICAYLEKKYSASTLYPVNPILFAA